MANRRVRKKLKLQARGTYHRADQWYLDQCHRRVLWCADELRLAIERHIGEPVDRATFLADLGVARG